MSSTKLCHHCKFFRPSTRELVPISYKFQNGFCTHHAATKLDVVSGTRIFEYAYIMRQDNGACGLSARYYHDDLPLASYVRVVVLDTSLLLPAIVCIVFICIAFKNILWNYHH